ncbi:hypothetical protein PYW08_011883 [Mythimna loreyi]|uniref:Uncharacterized protein n=1 Tax=Mythimna loreyi TaxID=667449 RepID=A0ACC2QLP1_9NEOP|nr:hypothetical protein PYW08_011883 [Mythimna loreyi]
MSTINNDTLAEHETCCMVTSAFGHSLQKGILIVGIASIITSMMALLPSIMYLLFMSSKHASYNSQPMMAIDLMCSLICSSIFIYQIVISSIMLWFLQEKKYVFLLSLWFGSNVVILAICFLLILARSAICFMVKEYVNGCLTIFFGIVYEVLFSYFCMIVSSYESSLNPETIYY